MKNTTLILGTIACLLSLVALGLRLFKHGTTDSTDLLLSVFLVLFTGWMAWSAYAKGERFGG